MAIKSLITLSPCLLRNKQRFIILGIETRAGGGEGWGWGGGGGGGGGGVWG